MDHKIHFVQKGLVTLFGLILIISSCRSPLDISQVVGKPTDTAVNIQGIVQQTLNAFTAVALESTNANNLLLNETSTSISLLPTATMTDTPSPSVTSPRDDPCFFSYYPNTLQIRWNYKRETQTLPVEQYEMYFERIAPESFVEYRQFDSQQLQIVWYCTPEGLVQNQFTQMSIPGIPEGFPLQTKEYSGVTFPNQENFIVGAAWKTAYSLQGSMSTDAGEMKAEIKIVVENTLTAMEEITLSFGTYPQAARVDSVVTILIDTQIGSLSGHTTEITQDYSAWYVEGIGKVKSVAREQAGDRFTELISVQ
jgi:hypothetical protein